MLIGEVSIDPEVMAAVERRSVAFMNEAPRGSASALSEG